MSKLFLLKGNPTKKEVATAKRAGRPLFLGVPLAYGKKGRICQLDCLFCSTGTETIRTLPLTLTDHKNIISQFAKMHGKYIKTANGGEPFLDSKFFRRSGTTLHYPLIDYANRLGLYWTSATNMLEINETIARDLSGRNVSLIGKLNSFDPGLHEILCGNTGEYSLKGWTDYRGLRIPVSLTHLIEAGFNEPIKENGVSYTRLGLNVVITRMNYEEIPKIVEFCIENNIYPDVDNLEVGGDSKETIEALRITGIQNMWLYAELSSILGKKFLDYRKETVADLCSIFEVGVVYNVDGSIRYCFVVPMDSDLNLKKQKLEDAYPLLLELKQSRKTLVLQDFVDDPSQFNICPNCSFI